jgi:hypothetical protein
MCATTPLVTGESSKCVKHSRYDVFQTHFSFHLFEEFVLGHAHTPPFSFSRWWRVLGFRVYSAISMYCREISLIFSYWTALVCVRGEGFVNITI